ncbi:hypothetical protein C8Q76DRAFT_608115 [Earliella scabrosa]|nr:hypothetical protein C8Q76DRAFT_608115 [Earliella scabrosa]
MTDTHSGEEDFPSLLKTNEPWFHAIHDGVVHNPLGAGSYVFQREPFKAALRREGTTSFPPTDSGISLHDVAAPGPSETTIFVHVGAQPNNSPHAGTIITFAHAFLFAQRLQRAYAELHRRALASGHDMSQWTEHVRAVIQLDIVDTAPDNSKTVTIDGVVYQRSHRSTGAMNSFLPDYHELLAALSAHVHHEVDFDVTYQDELMRSPAMRDALRAIIQDRERLAVELAPERECLAIRSACPVEGCSMADKHGVRNEYAVDETSTTVTFHCLDHGAYSIRLEDPDAIARIELNTPLRNLARGLVYMADTAASHAPGQAAPRRVHMRVTGLDYAGVYQEQLFYRQLSPLAKCMGLPYDEEPRYSPYISYAPMIVDWSGAKLSKSLYVKTNAYEYLKWAGLGYLLEYRRMADEGKDVRVLFKMVEGWMDEPKKLYGRVYSVEYLRLTFLVAEGRGRLRMLREAATQLPLGWVALCLLLGYGVARAQRVFYTV